MLLEVEHLSISYETEVGQIPAVRDVSFAIDAAECFALVGETGSGKTSVALALLRLLGNNGHILGGPVRFDGALLPENDSSAWQKVRGKQIGMVFQDARGALNPVLTIGSQLIEALRAHQKLDRKTARETAVALLTEVGIPDPAFHLGRYACELSGGLCQRAAIAIAICNSPRLLIADEPTSALDPGIQAQILQLLHEMRRRRALSILLISHDLPLVSEVSDRVAVMYHGRIVESGRTCDIFRRPAHPYTAGLIACQADFQHRYAGSPLSPIAGFPPAAGQEFPGCSFVPRCSKADPACSLKVPSPASVGDQHWAACIRPNA